VANVCALSVRDIRLIRDKVTNTSRGFCFVEMNNIEVSMYHLQKIHRVTVKLTVYSQITSSCGCLRTTVCV